MFLSTVRKAALAALCICASCFYVSAAHAGVIYNFSGVSNGGTASATMEIDIVGNTLTATINNTSPNPHPNPLNLGDPALTGFGFHFANADSLSMVSWCLTVGSDNVGGTCAGAGTAWLFETDMIDGADVDFGAETDKGIKGGIYAPGADNLGGNPRYFGEAVFTLTFNTAPTLEELFGPCNGNAAVGCSPFVRFQNVGDGGSLKLPAEQTCRTCDEHDVPEPGIVALMSIALMGAVFSRRAR